MADPGRRRSDGAQGDCGGVIGMSSIASLSQLGRLLGVSKKTAWEYTANPGWPFGVRPPWKRSLLAEMLAWQAALPGRQQGNAAEKSAGGQRDLTEARIDMTRASAQAKRLDTAIKAKKFHNAEECLIRRMNAIHQHKQDLYAMADGLPVDDAAKDLVRAGLDRLLRDLSTRYTPIDKPTRDQLRASLSRMLTDIAGD